MLLLDEGSAPRALAAPFAVAKSVARNFNLFGWTGNDEADRFAEFAQPRIEHGVVALVG